MSLTDLDWAREAWEESPDAIFATAPDGTVLSWNRAAEQIFGHTRAQALGKSAIGLFAGTGVSGQQGCKSMASACREQGADLVETQCVRKDGSVVDICISRKEIHDQHGDLRYTLFTNKDVTRLKAAHADERQTNAFQAGGLAGVSHDLRTPLNAIIGFSEFLLEGKVGALNARQREYLGDILVSGRNLLQLINDVLELNKLEAGRMELNPERFRVADVIEELCSGLSEQASDGQVALQQQDIAADLVAFMDRGAFLHVLHNIVSNALNVADSGSELRVGADRSADGTLHLRIHAAGSRIPDGKIARLFADLSRSDVGGARGGTGVGLTLTRRIIELQNGWITAPGDLPEGTTLTVSLPAGGQGSSGDADAAATGLFELPR
jgi:PAS domain S-box-containing protein